MNYIVITKQHVEELLCIGCNSGFVLLRYRKQMEEMQRAFNKTIIKLQNTSRIAEEQVCLHRGDQSETSRSIKTDFV